MTSDSPPPPVLSPRRGMEQVPLVEGIRTETASALRPPYTMASGCARPRLRSLLRIWLTGIGEGVRSSRARGRTAVHTTPPQAISGPPPS